MRNLLSSLLFYYILYTGFCIFAIDQLYHVIILHLQVLYIYIIIIYILLYICILVSAVWMDMYGPIKLRFNGSGK